MSVAAATSLDAARLYDLDPTVPDDLPFYRRRLGRSERLLELGCGTGRVLVPLAERCRQAWGVDRSAAMLEVCRERVAEAGLPAGRVRTLLADITALDLGERFELVVAPYRVFQYLIEEAAVDGFFATLRRHLAPGGRAVVSAFRPRDGRVVAWSGAGETLCWEVEEGNAVVTCHARGLCLDLEHQVERLELVYRERVDGALTTEALLPLTLRWYRPEQLLETIEAHGFRALQRWGGYRGEPYAEGDELVLTIAPR